jgi:hypothetical protein
MDQVFLFPVQDQSQPIGVSQILFKVRFLVIKEKVFFIPPHFQQAAAEFLGDFKKLHGAAQAVKIPVIDGDHQDHKEKAGRKGHDDLSSNGRGPYLHGLG